jgi:hypothetical protein
MDLLEGKAMLGGLMVVMAIPNGLMGAELARWWLECGAADCRARAVAEGYCAWVFGLADPGAKVAMYEPDGKSRFFAVSLARYHAERAEAYARAAEDPRARPPKPLPPGLIYYFREPIPGLPRSIRPVP